MSCLTIDFPSLKLKCPYSTIKLLETRAQLISVFKLS